MAESGISVPQDIIRALQDAKREKNVRFLKIEIQDEEMKLTKTVNRAGSWSKDMDSVPGTLDEKTAAYVVFYKDNGVVLMTYVPDKASVKDKMVYSSSKSALKKVISGDIEEYFGTSKDEFSYNKFNGRKNMEKPLSYIEKELQANAVQLSKKDMLKSAGYSIIAKVKDPQSTMPSKLLNDNSSSSSGHGSGASHVGHIVSASGAGASSLIAKFENKAHENTASAGPAPKASHRGSVGNKAESKAESKEASKEAHKEADKASEPEKAPEASKDAPEAKSDAPEAK